MQSPIPYRQPVTLRTQLLAIGLTIALAGTFVAPSAATQARKIKAIASTELAAGTPFPEELAPPLPERSDCEAMVLKIAAAYGTPDFDDYLHENFPAKSELVAALARSGLRVSNVRFEIEAIESIRVLPWVIVAEEEVDDAVVSTIGADCVVALQKRVLFDAAGGNRTISLPSRDEWRVRLQTTVEAGQEASR